jgi:hypothetical protein
LIRLHVGGLFNNLQHSVSAGLSPRARPIPGRPNEEHFMPACFTLTPIGTNEPAKLAAIDDAMCEAFGIEPDAERFHQGWVDCEGFALALGKDWDWMRQEWPDRVAIIDWLAKHYTPDAFYTRGR